MMNSDEVQALVGLDVAEARRRVKAKGWTFRVMFEDGVGRAGTADIRDDRVNVAVRGGKVEKAEVG
jgi:hypothetical protein